MEDKECIGVIAGKSGESIVREVHRYNRSTVLICGKDKESGYDISEYTYVCDLSDQDQAHKIFEMHNVRRVVFGTGHILAIELAKYLATKGVQINIEPDVSLLCKNKYALKVEMQRIGIGTPAFYLIRQEALLEDLNAGIEKIGVPCVLKSIKDIVTPQLVWDIESLQKETMLLLEKEPSVMIEEYVQGGEFTAVMNNDGDHIDCISILPWSKAQEDQLKGFNKFSNESQLSQGMYSFVKQSMERLIKFVNVLGTSRVDFIVKDDELYVLEINSIVFSGHTEGSLYAIGLVRRGIMLPNLIVKSAMNMMYPKESKPKRTSDKLIFVDERYTRNSDKKNAYVSRDCFIEVLEPIVGERKRCYDTHYVKNIFTYHGILYLEQLLEEYLKEQNLYTTGSLNLTCIMNFAAVLMVQNADVYISRLQDKRNEYLKIAAEFLNKEIYFEN